MVQNCLLGPGGCLMKKIGDNKNLVTLPLELLCCIKGCPKKARVLKTIKETLPELPNGLIIHTRAAYKNRSDIKKRHLL
jgi:hypothetical protein